MKNEYRKYRVYMHCKKCGFEYSGRVMEVEFKIKDLKQLCPKCKKIMKLEVLNESSI